MALHWTEPDGRCSCARPGCLTPGKHLKNRCATRDPDVVRAWWRRWPRANVGLATGPGNGFFVLDVDLEGDGERSLRALVRGRGPLPPTAAVRTGSGGRHLYFRHPGRPVPSREDWRSGLDVRADDAYVVAPPSLHRSGRRYRWLGGPAVAAAPSWLADLLAHAGP